MEYLQCGGGVQNDKLNKLPEQNEEERFYNNPLYYS